MAGDWIKMETSLPDKPEVWSIASSLDIDPDAVVGKLFLIWSWFDQQTETGNAPSVTKKLLDRRVGVTGFCDAMVESGWMLDDDQTVSLPNFDRHNGKTAKNRALTAKRAAKHKRNSNDNGNDNSVTDALPREEKRREENTSSNEEESSAEPIDFSAKDACPAKDIVHAYHEELPELPRVAKLTDKRKKWLQARWREDSQHQSVDFWRRLFRYIRESDFLTGNNNRGWTADFEWIVNVGNFYKIIEGKYHHAAA